MFTDDIENINEKALIQSVFNDFKKFTEKQEDLFETEKYWRLIFEKAGFKNFKIEIKEKK